jgi:hypothetical protein
MGLIEIIIVLVLVYMVMKMVSGAFNWVGDTASKIGHGISDAASGLGHDVGSLF